jgi:hypothetical protein
MHRSAIREFVAVARIWVLLAFGIGACESNGARSFVERIERASPPRASVARFSVVQHYERCSSAEVDPHRPLPCETSVDVSIDARHPELAADIARSFHQGHNDVVRAAALLDLLWPAGGEASILRSIDLLDAVARSPDGDALVMSDIAAAHLLRAEIGDDPRATLAAAEAALRALELLTARVKPGWTTCASILRPVGRRRRDSAPRRSVPS